MSCHRFRFTLYDGVSGHPCVGVLIYRLSKLPTTHEVCSGTRVMPRCCMHSNVCGVAMLSEFFNDLCFQQPRQETQ